jgi:glycolate oxidase iron-sulfur subunit
MAMLASTERWEPSRSAGGARESAPAVRSRNDAKAAAGPRGGRVGFLEGCVMEGLFTETNRATERVLVANGYALAETAKQRCCGALHAHAGDAEGARRLAKHNIVAFETSNPDFICVNAAGCGAMMKEYAHLLGDDPEWCDRAARISAKVRDVSELVSAGDRAPERGGPSPVRVAYDAPCHLLHAQRIANAPLDMLRAIPELELVPLAESDMCCGSAGIYNLVEPDTSNVVLERKLANIARTDADVVATGNPGCLMQIGAGLLRSGARTRAVHLVDLLDRSYRNSASR